MRLQKKLGIIDGAVLVFSNVIGVGIFTTPGIVAQSVSTSGAFLTLWLIGGVYALIGAFGYAQLSAKYPKAGGEYIYLKNSFGPLAGFLSGWASFVAGFSGAIAASAVGFGLYLTRIYPQFSGKLLGLSAESLLAVVLIIGVTIVHMVSVKAGSRFHYWLGGLAVVLILVLAVAGIFSLTPDSQAPTDHIPKNGNTYLLALIPILFTYSGWNAAVYISEEIPNPKRNVKKALLLGTSAVIAIYLLINFLFLRILGLNQMAESLEVGYDLSNTIMGARGSLVITFIILLALLSSVSAMTMAGPRIYFAMGRDGVFPGSMMRIHSRFDTPYMAIMGQSLWSILLVLTGTFEDILIYTGFSIVLFSGLSVASVAIDRRFHLPLLQKLLYACFGLCSLVLVLNAIYAAPKPALFGTGIILMGVPIYWWQKRKIRRPG